jgi:TrmH family RNA methyltransferase
VEKDRIDRLSVLDTPARSLAVFPRPQFPNSAPGRTEYFFDRIKDPGNLGTVVRTAAWFGIARIWCSPESVDPFNPKVVQASMGGIATVEVRTARAEDVLETWRAEGRRIFKTGMKGLAPGALVEIDRLGLIFGSEGDGIRPEIDQMLSETVSISRAPNSSMESLNLAISTGILMHIRES